MIWKIIKKAQNPLCLNFIKRKWMKSIKLFPTFGRKYMMEMIFRKYKLNQKMKALIKKLGNLIIIELL